MWISHSELAAAPGHPFYQQLNELLEAEGFDEFVEERCGKFYGARYGRPSLTPAIYFRALLIGYFEGIRAERCIAWRLADSLALRRFVGVGLDESTPDLSTISRTRQLIDVDTHGEAFSWVLGVLADRGLLKGKRIAIDATTLEAAGNSRTTLAERSCCPIMISSPPKMQLQQSMLGTSYFWDGLAKSVPRIRVTLFNTRRRGPVWR